MVAEIQTKQKFFRKRKMQRNENANLIARAIPTKLKRITVANFNLFLIKGKKFSIRPSDVKYEKCKKQKKIFSKIT